MCKSLLLSTANTRELGDHPAADGGVTKFDRIWRSDAPIDPTGEDTILLQSKGIRTVIDLRSDEEVRRRPTALSCTAGFDYRHLPVTEGSEPPDSFEKVPLSYMEIAAAKSLPRVFETIADADGGVMFFCTAGKDRTGVVSAILLLTCGVDRETVCRDYALSRKYNKLRLEQYLAEHPETDRRIVTANEESMESFIEMFLEKYGSLPQYFETVCGTQEIFGKIKSKLTEG